ncbi:MAG: hypothetical protein AAF996_01305 [Pseudomonadota bacterium]
MLTRRDLFLGKLRLRDKASSERGATAVEYGLLAGVFGIVAVSTWSKFKRRDEKSN